MIHRLQEQGYSAYAVTLPSTSGDPKASLLDDIEAVKTVVMSQIERGHNVIIAVHSYGGFVGESAMKSLPTRRNPSSESVYGKVIGLALMGTGFTQAGLSFIDGLGGKPPPFWRANTQSGFAELIGDTTALFYHDLPAKEGELWAKRLLPQSLKSLFEGGEHVYTGWKDVPVWYLITLEDRGLPVEAARWMATNARREGADVTVREISSGHCPMLSMPKQTVEFLLEAAKALG